MAEKIITTDPRELRKKADDAQARIRINEDRAQRSYDVLVALAKYGQDPGQLLSLYEKWQDTFDRIAQLEGSPKKWSAVQEKIELEAAIVAEMEKLEGKFFTTGSAMYKKLKTKFAAGQDRIAQKFCEFLQAIDELEPTKQEAAALATYLQEVQDLYHLSNLGFNLRYPWGGEIKGEDPAERRQLYLRYCSAALNQTGGQDPATVDRSYMKVKVQ